MFLKFKFFLLFPTLLIICDITYGQKINRLKSINDVLKIRERSIFKISKFEDGKRKSVGTGFFINKNGLAITNFHVMYKSGGVLNSSSDQKSFLDMNNLVSSKVYQYLFQQKDGVPLPTPKVLGCGNENNLDICYLKFELKKTAYIPLENVKVGTGHKTYSIGYCGGKLNIKNGEIKKYHKNFLSYYNINNMNFNLNTKMIEISNPICPGDSGGPIFNSSGNLVGVTTIRFSRPRKNEKMENEVDWWLLGITVDEVKKVKRDKSISILGFKKSVKKVRRPEDPFYIP